MADLIQKVLVRFQHDLVFSFYVTDIDHKVLPQVLNHVLPDCWNRFEPHIHQLPVIADCRQDGAKILKSVLELVFVCSRSFDDFVVQECCS